MDWFQDIRRRKIRLTSERREHLETAHPEMEGQIDRIRLTLLEPEWIIQSQTDERSELFYRYYLSGPVGDKYLCVVVKVNGPDLFVLTAYFTDTVKKGEILWEKK